MRNKAYRKTAVTIPLAVLMLLLIFILTANLRVERRLENMSLRQKVTQTFMMEFRTWDDGENGEADFTVMNDDVRRIIEDYDFGAVILFAQNIKTTEETYALVNEMQAAAGANGGIPLLIATDQEGGAVYRLGSGTALPGNMALAATQDTENAYLAGGIIGRELGCLGINTDLAPVVDVNSNANNPVIGLRSFSDDADTVGKMASKYIEGLDCSDVIGCAKHFPGHGDTDTDSHYGLPVVDKPLYVLLGNELRPFGTAISNGIEMIMTAHILYPQLEADTVYSEKTGKYEVLPATMSDDIISGLLKDRMGFDGIVCTDAMKMAGVSDFWDEVQASVNALKAGADMICIPTDVGSIDALEKLDTLIDGIIAAVESGEIPEERLDDACRRILTVKLRHGLLDCADAKYSLDEALNTMGSTENRTLEREISAKAVTVTENKNSLLPLKLTENSKLLIYTPYNNECAQLVMGWNRAKAAGLVPDGAQVRVICYGNEDFSDYEADINWADTVLTVSEISSPKKIMDNAWTYAVPQALLECAVENGRTTAVMSVDKPYDVQLYPNADAVLAVYGCKGSAVDPTEALMNGITDSEAACGPNITAGIEVALGVFGAGGKLPVDIPKLDKQTYSYTDEIIYPRSYGLTYPALIANK